MSEVVALLDVAQGVENDSTFSETRSLKNVPLAACFDAALLQNPYALLIFLQYMKQADSTNFNVDEILAQLLLLRNFASDNGITLEEGLLRKRSLQLQDSAAFSGGVRIATLVLASLLFIVAFFFGSAESLRLTRAPRKETTRRSITAEQFRAESAALALDAILAAQQTFAVPELLITAGPEAARESERVQAVVQAEQGQAVVQAQQSQEIAANLSAALSLQLAQESTNDIILSELQTVRNPNTEMQVLQRYSQMEKEERKIFADYILFNRVAKQVGAIFQLDLFPTFRKFGIFPVPRNILLSFQVNRRNIMLRQPVLALPSVSSSSLDSSMFARFAAQLLYAVPTAQIVEASETSDAVAHQQLVSRSVQAMLARNNLYAAPNITEQEIQNELQSERRINELLTEREVARRVAAAPTITVQPPTESFADYFQTIEPESIQPQSWIFDEEQLKNFFTISAATLFGGAAGLAGARLLYRKLAAVQAEPVLEPFAKDSFFAALETYLDKLLTYLRQASSLKTAETQAIPLQICTLLTIWMNSLVSNQVQQAIEQLQQLLQVTLSIEELFSKAKQLEENIKKASNLQIEEVMLQTIQFFNNISTYTILQGGADLSDSIFDLQGGYISAFWEGLSARSKSTLKYANNPRASVMEENPAEALKAALQYVYRTLPNYYGNVRRNAAFRANFPIVRHTVVRDLSNLLLLSSGSEIAAELAVQIADALVPVADPNLLPSRSSMRALPFSRSSHALLTAVANGGRFGLFNITSSNLQRSAAAIVDALLTYRLVPEISVFAFVNSEVYMQGVWDLLTLTRQSIDDAIPRVPFAPVAADQADQAVLVEYDPQNNVMQIQEAEVANNDAEPAAVPVPLGPPVATQNDSWTLLDVAAYFQKFLTNPIKTVLDSLNITVTPRAVPVPLRDVLPPQALSNVPNVNSVNAPRNIRFYTPPNARDTLPNSYALHPEASAPEEDPSEIPVELVPSIQVPNVAAPIIPLWQAAGFPSRTQAAVNNLLLETATDSSCKIILENAQPRARRVGERDTDTKEDEEELPTNVTSEAAEEEPVAAQAPQAQAQPQAQADLSILPTDAEVDALPSKYDKAKEGLKAMLKQLRVETCDCRALVETFMIMFVQMLVDEDKAAEAPKATETETGTAEAAEEPEAEEPGTSLSDISVEPILEARSSRKMKYKSWLREIFGEIMRLNRGDGTFLPKTFSILQDTIIPRLPFTHDIKTLEDYVNSAVLYPTLITAETTRALLFQIVWTLAVLQKEWSGYQHNDLFKNIRVVRYAQARCFRIVATDSQFCIPQNMPLPVFTGFGRSNGLASDTWLKRREEDIGCGACQDLEQVLQKMLTPVTSTLPSFEPAKELLEEIKSEACECLPKTLLFANVFHEYTESIASMARAQVDSF